MWHFVLQKGVISLLQMLEFKAHFWVLFVAAVAGFELMGLEMVASRMLQPFFGTSIYVWGILIGVIFAAMSFGYLLGGMLADKNPSKHLLSKLLLLSALFLFASLLFYHAILVSFLGADLVTGVLVSTLLLFAPATILLSAVSPFLIKIAAAGKGVGSASGKILFASTVGGILGIAFSVFFLIPTFGSRISLSLLFAIILLVAVAGLFPKDRRFSFALLLLFALLVVPSKVSPSIIYETESAYSYIMVKENGPLLELWFDHLIGRESLTRKTILSHSIYDYLVIGPEINGGKEILLLGLGGGTMLKPQLAFFEGIQIDAVEIDQKVVETAKNFFGVKESSKLAIYVEDARTFLSKSSKKYDVIEIDLYNGIEPPVHTLTKEFFQLASNRLKRNGVIEMNVVSAEEDNELIHAIGNTVCTVFPSVFTLRHGNTLMVATKEQTTLRQIKEKILASQVPELNTINLNAAQKIKEFNCDSSKKPLTDDLAPIEALIFENNQKIINRSHKNILKRKNEIK